MMKKLLSAALIFSGFIINAQSFTAVYDFAATTTVSGTTDPTPTPTATGVSFGSFSAVGTPSANANAAGRFSFVGWPTGAANGNDTYASMTGSININEYFEVTLTPQSGYTVGLNSIGFTVQRSGTGIRNYVVRTSADGFTNNLPASVTTNTNLSVVGTNVFFWNLDALSNAQNGSTISLFGATVASSVSFRFYAWNSEANTGTFSIDNVVFNGSVSGGTVACNSPTITSISSVAPICAGQTLTLQSTVAGDTPIGYSWSGTGSFGSANSPTTVVTGAAQGNYTLAVINACGSATSVVTATVNPLSVVSVNSASICLSQQTATLTANGAATYNWAPATGLSATSGSLVLSNPAADQTYTVTGVDANGCANTATSSVIINALPTITVNSSTICSGQSATLTVNGATTYSWMPSTGLSASTGSMVLSSPSADQSYTVMGIDANGCENAAISSVMVNALPTISIDYSSPVSIECENSIDTLIASGGVNYAWSTSQVNDTIIITHVIGGPVSFTVVGTDANGCANADSYSFAGIAAQDVVTVDLSAISLLCLNSGTVTLATATPTNGIWSGTGVTGGVFDPMAAGVGTYTITYTSTGTSCPNSGSDEITVDACTGIKALNQELVSVYPNPANSFVSVQSTVFPAKLTIYDVSGKLIVSKTIESSETLVDLSDMVNGVYHLNIISGQHSFNHKLVISK